MSDSISRQSTLEAIQRHFNPTGEEMPTEVAAVLVGVGVVISTQPSADRKGHWVVDMYDSRGGAWCDNCTTRFTGVSIIGGKVQWDFCPKCGADMRGVDDESTL